MQIEGHGEQVAAEYGAELLFDRVLGPIRDVIHPHAAQEYRRPYHAVLVAVDSQCAPRQLLDIRAGAGLAMERRKAVDQDHPAVPWCDRVDLERVVLADLPALRYADRDAARLRANARPGGGLDRGRLAGLGVVRLGFWVTRG